MKERQWKVADGDFDLLVKMGEQVEYTWAPGPTADPYAGSGRHECQELARFRADGPPWPVASGLMREMAAEAGASGAPWVARAELGLAVLAGDLAAVNALIAAGVDVNGPAFGRPPLVAAVAEHKPKVALALLDAGADARAKPKDYVSLLAQACEKGSGIDAVALVRRLVRAGLSPNESSPDGSTPFITACCGADAGVVKALLELGARRDGLPGGRVPLSWAVGLDNSSAVGVLVKAGADINARDERGETPLLQAASHVHVYLLERLLELGADTAEILAVDAQTGKPRLDRYASRVQSAVQRHIAKQASKDTRSAP